MDIIKLVAGFACGILTLLLFLIGFAENPEKKLFEETVESLMIERGLSSRQEVFEGFPELRDIKSKMKRIAYLRSCVYALTGGPAPNVSEQESQQIGEYNKEIRQLKEGVKEKLTQLFAHYALNRP